MVELILIVPLCLLVMHSEETILEHFDGWVPHLLDGNCSLLRFDIGAKPAHDSDIALHFLHLVVKSSSLVKLHSILLMKISVLFLLSGQGTLELHGCQLFVLRLVAHQHTAAQLKSFRQSVILQLAVVWSVILV